MRILFALIMFLTPFTAKAEMTGEKLYYLCSGSLPEDSGTCQGYLSGIIDYHTILKSVNMTPGVDFCIPSSVGYDQLQKDVVIYFRENKQHAEFLASPAIALAFSQIYPCKK